MSSVQDVNRFGRANRNRAARRQFYGDWAIFFTVVALMGAALLMEVLTGSASTVTGTLDRLNEPDAAAAADPLGSEDVASR